MVQLLQYLCPKRHCVLAVAFNEGEAPDIPRQAILSQFKPKGVFNHWCGICGSKDLHFETDITKFKTMAEAADHLYKSMGDQIATRAALDEAGLSYDAQQKERADNERN